MYVVVVMGCWRNAEEEETREEARGLRVEASRPSRWCCMKPGKVFAV
jgi:hypothetical protein